MKTESSKLVDENSNGLVDLSIIDLALFKETKEIAEVLYIVNGDKVNLKELYNEMWLLDKKTK